VDSIREGDRITTSMYSIITDTDSEELRPVGKKQASTYLK
jgi:hypothetical protein